MEARKPKNQMIKRFSKYPIEVFDEKHFKETSKDGYETSFTITVVESLMKYSFLMDNENLSGEMQLKLQGQNTL